jgi:hypothetical protein
MPIAISTDRREYVLAAEQSLPREKQTRFFIKPLSGRERARLDDMARYSETSRKIKSEGFELQIPDNANEITFETVCIGLVGWENLLYESGGECPFTESNEKNLSHLDDLTIQELYLEIKSLSSLTEAEAGNSDSPPNGLQATKKRRGKQ